MYTKGRVEIQKEVAAEKSTQRDFDEHEADTDNRHPKLFLRKDRRGTPDGTHAITKDEERSEERLKFSQLAKRPNRTATISVTQLEIRHAFGQRVPRSGLEPDKTKTRKDRDPQGTGRETRAIVQVIVRGDEFRQDEIDQEKDELTGKSHGIAFARHGVVELFFLPRGGVEVSRFTIGHDLWMRARDEWQVRIVENQSGGNERGANDEIEPVDPIEPILGKKEHRKERRGAHEGRELQQLLAFVAIIGKRSEGQEQHDLKQDGNRDTILWETCIANGRTEELEVLCFGFDLGTPGRVIQHAGLIRGKGTVSTDTQVFKINGPFIVETVTTIRAFGTCQGLGGNQKWEKVY